MRLVISSRFVNIAVVLGDSADIDDDDDVEMVSNTGGSFGFAPGYDETYYEDGEEDG